MFFSASRNITHLVHLKKWFFQYQMCYSEQGCSEDLIVLGRDEAEVLVVFQTLRQPEVQSSAEVKKISFK